jgi:hypothetical protein
MKKFLMTVALAFAVTLTSAAPVNAATLAETLAALGLTPAQIAMVVSASATTPAVTTGTSMFSAHNGVNLQVGSRGARVMELQSCMNAAGYPTGVADGVFGANTAAGVRSFQAAKGLAVDGIVGQNTTPAFQAACPTAVVIVVPDAGTLPAGCSSTVGFSTTTGVKCDSEESSSTPEFPATGGNEASLEKFEMDSEDDAEEGQMTHVATIEFDVEDGDVLIERLDLTFVKGNLGGTADTDPWDVFETITLMVDGDEIAEEDVDDEDDWNRDNSPFVFRLTGLDTVVAEGDTIEIEVYLTAVNNVDDSANANWTIYVANEGIRGTDTAGLTQEIGDTLDTVSFSMDEEGGDEEIKIKSSNNDPDSALLKVDEDDEVEHEVFVFKLEAEENDIEIDEIVIDVILGNVDYARAINDVTLEMGNDEVEDFTVVYYNTVGFVALDTSVTSTSFARLTFDIDGDFEIDGDDDEEVTVIVEFKKADQDNDGIDDGIFDQNLLTKTIQVGVRSVDGEGVDDVEATATFNSSVHTLTLTDAEITTTSTPWAKSGTDSSGVIDFTFTVNNSDSDEDFEVLTADIIDTVLGATFQAAGAVNTGALEGTLSQVSGDSVTPLAGNAGFIVSEGDTSTFRVRYVATGVGVYEVSISEIAGVQLADNDELSPTLILEA